LNSNGLPPYRIEVFRSRSQRLLFLLVPFLTVAFLAWNDFFASDPMVGTGLAGAVAGFWVFLVFAARVPRSFAIVSLRGLVLHDDQALYLDFERDVERLLNSRWSLLPGAVGILFALAYFPIRAGGLAAVFGTGSGSLHDLGSLVWAIALGMPLLWFMAGLAIWRMVIVGWKLDDLGRRFPLQLQMGHPDGCGGFEPLGSLSLWNALILAIPGLFLGWWIAIGPTSQYGTRWLAFDSALAVIVVVLAGIAFVAPLWNVHRAMARSAEQLRVEVEQRGREIDRLARELLARPEALTSEARAQKAKDLELQQGLYRDSEAIPTWPINLRLALKFGSSQLVPLLGLTGLGKPVVDALQRLSTFLSGG
jgi:hypothetical protein